MRLNLKILSREILQEDLKWLLKALVGYKSLFRNMDHQESSKSKITKRNLWMRVTYPIDQLHPVEFAGEVMKRLKLRMNLILSYLLATVPGQSVKFI